MVDTLPRGRVCIESPIKQQSEEVIQCVAIDCYALVNPSCVHPTGQPGASPLESSESSVFIMKCLAMLWIFCHPAQKAAYLEVGSVVTLYNQDT